MNVSPNRPVSQERVLQTMSGWPVLALNLAICVGVPFIFASAVRNSSAPLGFCGVIVAMTMMIVWGGFFTLQPNEARVLVLFGEYRGTARESGFHWTNPFMRKMPISLRARNLNGEKLKV